MFQIWRRSVHKSGHNVVHRCQTPDGRSTSDALGVRDFFYSVRCYALHWIDN